MLALVHTPLLVDRPPQPYHAPSGSEVVMSTPLLYALIPHVSEPRLLLLPTSNGWMLPRLSSGEPRDVAQDLRAQFGIDTIVLGTVYDRYDDEMDPIEQIYVVEQRGGTLALPDGACWAGREELERLPLAVPAHRAALAAWLAERGGWPVPPERPPWARPGWFAQAEAWIGGELRRLDVPLAGALVQERVSPTSCVLRVPGAAHTLYFKASAPVFGYEPALTAALGALWPEAVPRVRALDAERGWMLIEDAGPSLREITQQDRDLGRWEVMLRQFAQLQKESTAHLERLQGLGCPDRRLGRLPDLFDELLREPARLLIGQAGGLSDAEYARLRALQPELEALCGRLAAYTIPAMLHHDDFSAGNIGVRG